MNGRGVLLWRGFARGGRRATLFLCVLSLVSSTLAVGASAQSAMRQESKAQASKRLTEEQRILHVLNRLGFGARPGDVERVRAAGLEKYVEQQLNPEKLDDSLLEAKLKNLPTLNMSTGELLAKYPSPGGLVRQLQRRGELPPELAAIVEQRRNGGQQTPAANDDAAKSRTAMNAPENEALPNMEGANEERTEYRRALRRYMAENGMQPPQRVLQELQASRILRAVHSERQLQEVMVDFWSNHFNVFALKGADRWLLTSYDRDVIRPRALGKFRDLLGATAKSPAMLFFLDNYQSVSPNARPQRKRAAMGMPGARRRRMMNMPQAGDQQPRPQAQQQRRQRGINENYARELMELHTLGVDGGYTQKDIQEIARAFTGWTIKNPRGYVDGGDDAGTFVFNPRQHDDGEKIVLGQKIPAGGGMRDGETVLDILARHPSTAKFIATKLARRFVSDNPSPALVVRVSAAYMKSDGDVRATLRAIFTSPEFNSPESYRAKIKTPFEVVVSAIRTLGGETDGGPALHQWIARMGEPLYLYQAPTGYPDTADAWVNTGALLERLNFALALAANRIPGTRVDLSRFAGDGANSSRPIEQERVVDQFLKAVLHDDVSPKTRTTLMKQLSDQSGAPIAAGNATNDMSAESGAGGMRRGGRRGGRRGRLAGEGATVGNPEVARIAALVVGSPEFQRQ